ncbi:MAG TPA: family 16 glycoside hydrolase, partial [Lacipirellula sp.]
DLKVQDVDMTVRIKAVRGEREQSGGLVWRYKNPGSYLVARLDVADGNVRLFRFWNGNRVQIGLKGELPLKTGEWYTLRVEHQGKHIKVYLNGDIMFMVHDKHFHHPGQVGLWTKSHSVMYFDDLSVKNLDDPNE